jgi:predicted acylesterase/phospholipase RssA
VSDQKVGEGGSESLSPPHLLQTLKQSIAVVETSLQYLLLRQQPPYVLISPAIHEFDLLSFHQAKGFIAAGEDASTACLPEIFAVLSRNSSS